MFRRDEELKILQISIFWSFLYLGSHDHWHRGKYDVSMRIIFLQVNDRLEGSGLIYIASMQSSLFFAGVFAWCKCLCQQYGGTEEDGAILTTIEIKG